VTLTTRLSVFFLVMLGLVLAGFSAATYVLARAYLRHQTADRLQAALNTLVAAVEIGPDGVEWEPAQRTLTFGRGAGGDQLAWLISSGRGRVVDRSADSADDDLLAETAERLRDGDRKARRVSWRGERWEVAQRWVYPTENAASESPPGGKAETKYPALAITAGVPLGPMYATLRRLAWSLTGVSAVIWFLALALSRAVCRRALRPVSRMATAARGMSATDPEERLPVPAARDELADLSQAFNGLLDRLQESFERQRRFTGDASHQLRTPLAALLGQIEVVLRRDRDADEYRQVLVKLQSQALHLRQIVEALLFLARADAEARLPERERLSLADWLEGHLRGWAEHPRAGDLHVERTKDERWEIEAQPVLLGELVDILLDNACKYSQPGTPITVRLGRDDDRVLLAVTDRGCGLTDEDLPHLWEPFYRSAEARRRGTAGLGLGLAIAQRIAEAQGGELSANSKVGVGSCFTLSLPAAAPAP
jgi:heavy metal sensor kinase